MKLTILLLTVSFLHVHAAGWSQKLSLHLKNASLQQIFKEIKRQTSYVVVAEKSRLESGKKISIEVNNASLNEVLAICFEGQPYTYSIEEGKYIVIQPKVAPSGVVTAFDQPPFLINIRVTDSAGNALPGITITLKKSRILGITNPEGAFSTYVNIGDVLVFSSTGFQPAERSVSDNAPLTIVLRASVTKLEEVNVVLSTGFQKIPIERATGSFSKPDMEVFKKRTSSTDLIARLEGQVAGLQVGLGTGSYTANTNGNGVTTRKSLIRGVSTVGLPPEPLYVVNGVIIPEFSAVNLDDVEDITVLKDAAAAAIWGARAANGVIVITTKSGNKSQRVSINYSGFLNYQGRPDFSYSRMMNSKQFIQTAKEIFDPVAYPWSSVNYSGIAPHEQILYARSEGSISADEANRRLDSLASIDNLGQISDLFYRPQITNNHTLSASGGNNIYSFYASLNYTGAQSATPGQKSNAYRVNLTQNLTAGSRVKITLNTSLSNNVNSATAYPSVSSTFLPYQLFRDANGHNTVMNYMRGYPDSVLTEYQKLSRINLDYVPMSEIGLERSTINNLSMNVTANATVKLWKGFSFIGTYGYQKSPGTFTNYYDHNLFQQRMMIVSLTEVPTPTSKPIYHLPPDGGYFINGANDQRNWTVRNQLAYEGMFRQGRDHLTVQVGNDVQEGYNYRTHTSVFGYNEVLGTFAMLDYATLRNGIGGTVTGYGSLYDDMFRIEKATTRFLSYFGLASYGLNNKYFFDASLRQDYSNNFGKNLSSQNDPTWSFGARWTISKERFLQSADWLSSLSLRASHGITGNSPYAGAAALEDRYSYISASTSPNAIAGDALSVNIPASKALSWEKTHVTNIGIDFSLFKSRFGGSLEVYEKSTRNLVGSVPLNPWTGRRSLSGGNIGNLVNKGIEITLHSENMRSNDFSWTTSFTFSYNYNKLLSYSALNPLFNTPDNIVSGGFPIAGYNTAPLFAYRFAGLDNLGDPQIRLSDKTVTKKLNIAKVTDLAYMGTTRPPFYGGFANTFTYKGFNLSLNAVYNMGGVMRRDVNSFYTGRFEASTSFSGPNIQTYFLDRWKKPGDEAFTNIPSYIASSSVAYSRRNISYYSRGDINVVSSSYIKLRDVTLTYTMPAKLLTPLRIQQASVFVQTSNYKIWTANSDGIDPEVQRTPGTALPAHGFSMGINLSF